MAEKTLGTFGTNVPYLVSKLKFAAGLAADPQRLGGLGLLF